jgi:ribonuclease HI
MKKKLLNYTKVIKSHLPESSELSDAIELIKSKINDLEEPEVIEGELPLPVDFSGDFALFSDGGCRGNPGPGAWGIVGQTNDGAIIFEESGFDTHTTNNKMELLGAIKALEKLTEINPLIGDQQVNLYTDSKYVVDGINTWVDGWKRRGWKKADKKTPENLELWQSLDLLKASFSNLNFLWVKGHSGHPQNDRCDKLANNEMDHHLL